MKIALIGQKGIPAKAGGIERHVEQLALGLKALGQDVFVYSRPWYTENKNTDYKNINIVNLPSIKTKHLDAITHTFLATIHALFSDYDVIHYHGVGPSLLSFIPKIFKPKAKVISTFHCIDRKHQKWGFGSRLALRLGELCAIKFPHETICVSQTLQQYCQDVYDTDTNYIPNGVNIPSSINTDSLLKELNLEPNKYILFVSRLVRHKGAHYLIEAFKNLETDLKLVIVGGSAFTDDYVAELKKMGENNSKIVFTGTQTGQALEELFANSLLFVQPSESEGLPITLLEALSYAKPALVSDIPENLEVISKDKFGFSFKNKNVADLTEKLKYLISNQNNLADLGYNAREHVKQNYNWENIVAQVLELYKKK